MARVLRIGVTLLWAGAALLVLLISVTLLGLQTARGRAIACSWSLDIVNRAIPGQIRVERCAELGPRMLRLHGVSVRDPSDREILRVESLNAAPDWPVLMSGKIAFHRAHAEGPMLRLIDHGTDLAIVSAFVSSTETSPDDEDDAGVSLSFEIIEVTNGRLTDLADGLLLDDIAVRTSLAWEESLVLEVEHAEATLTQRSEPTARLSQAGGTLHFEDAVEVDARAVVEAHGTTADLDFVFKGPMERLSLKATVDALGGRVVLRADNDAGRVEAHLQATGLSLREVAAETRGVVDAELDGILVFSQPGLELDALERIEAKGNLDVSSLVVSEIRAGRISVDGHLQGRLPTPRVHAVMKADELKVQGRTVDNLQLTIDGAGGDYHASGRAPLPNGWIVGIDLDSYVDWPSVRLGGEVSLANAPLSPLTAELSELVFQSGESISAKSVSIVGRGIDLEARGRYGLDRPSDISFQLRALDLAKLSDAFNIQQQLKGQLQGGARFRGTVRSPDLRATFRMENGAIESVSVESLEASVRYATRRGSAEARVRADLGDRGHLSLRTRAAFVRGAHPEKALASARYDARLVLETLSVETLNRLTDAGLAAKGTLSADVNAEGTLDALDLTLVAQGQEISSSRLLPTDVNLEATLNDGKASARAEATRSGGEAMAAGGTAQMSLRELFSKDGAKAILGRPWELWARVPEQPMAALPVELDAPASPRLSFTARAAGGRGSIDADLEADLRFSSKPSTDYERQADCPDRKPARLRMSARLRNQTSEIDVNGYVAHERVLSGGARAETPLERWITEGWPATWPEIQAKLELEPLVLDAVPIVCEHAKGQAQASLDVTRLFNPEQQVDLRLEATGLALRNGSPVDAVLRAEASSRLATATLDLRSNEQRLARLDARAPLQVQTAGEPVGLGRGEVRISAHFDHAPLSVLLAPVPIVARPDGRLDGDLALTGEARDFSTWEMKGAIELADASMTLKDPFLRLDRVDADLEIEPDRWVVRSLSTHDREGRIEARGTIGVSDWEPREVAFSLEADEYPLRREGVPLGTLNGQIEVRGDLGADPRTLRMELGKDVSLVLPDELRYGVQDLTQHPLVIYEGQPGFDPSLSVDEALREHAEGEPLEEAGGPLIVHVISKEPFWVRRPDFSMQLGVDLRVHSEEDASWIEGEVALRRGFLVLLSKNFDVKSGTISFTGSTPVDPTVDLSATHRLRSGYVVTIDVEGRISDLELTFSSDAPGANTNAEVIALLLGVSRQGTGDQRAEDQTRSVLAGLTAGLVGSLARRELGQYAPIIALESEGTAETTRIRAGVTLGDLIPDSWQDVLLGVYVEGMLAGSEEGPRGGFLLELLYPHHLSTTTTYEQPDNWSLDFLWQP